MSIDRYRALADPTRRRVLAAVADGGHEGVTAGELAATLGLGRSLVSYHLARLQAGGLVALHVDSRDGRRHRYLARVARPGTEPAERRAAASEPDPPPAASARRPGGPGGGPRTAPALDAPAGVSPIGTDSRRGPSRLPTSRPVRPRAPAPSPGAPFDPNLRVLLAPYLHRRMAGVGEALFWQGDPAGGLWFVESGAVRVYTADAEGREQTLQVVRAGESLNEVPFFDGGPEPATAQVVEEGTLYQLPIERRDAALREVPALAAAAAASFAARLRQTVALVEDLRFHQVAGRVARVLLQRVEPHPGVGAGSGARSLTQREIAEMAGTSREVVARALRELEQRGLIRLERGRIVLLDPAGLAVQD